MDYSGPFLFIHTMINPCTKAAIGERRRRWASAWPAGSGHLAMLGSRKRGGLIVVDLHAHAHLDTNGVSVQQLEI